MNELKRLYMLQICDSLFPIGAFTLSNGLETYVQHGAVHSPETLAAYLTDYLALAPYQELGVAALAMQYAPEPEAWQRLDRLYTACRAPMEVRQGSAKLCMRLMKAAEQIAPVESLREYRSCIADGVCTGQHPVAVGLFAAAHEVDRQEALSIYGYSLLSGLTTHAAKCVPLRQLEAQRVLRESFPQLLEAVQTALSVTEDEIGVGGPVGSGKTALIERLTRRMSKEYSGCVITNDIYTREDAEFLIKNSCLPPERIIGVETGGCPHTAIREDCSMNLEAVDEMAERFPDVQIIFIESGGDNLSATFSPDLADASIYVIDVAQGEKIPRKGGPGVTRSDLLVINKIDLAPLVGASLEVMASDSARMREGRKFLFTNLVSGEGLDDVISWIKSDVLFEGK